MTLTTRFFLACGTAALIVLWAIYSEKFPGLFEKGMIVVGCLLAVGYTWKFVLPFFIHRTLIVVGGIYSTIVGRDKQRALMFGISKVLLHENAIVHVRLYKNLFSERPQSIDVSSLSLGQMGKDEFPGAGHMPMSKTAFAKQIPILITRVDVEAKELAGYEEWKKQGGGVFNW